MKTLMMAAGVYGGSLVLYAIWCYAKDWWDDRRREKDPNELTDY